MARSRRARARLPARPARGGARLRRDLRRLAGRRRLHRGLRRGRHRGPLRRPRPADLVPAEAAPERQDLPAAAAALPVRDRVARPARVRPRHLLLERVGARRPARARRRPRLLLPQPVPLRVVRARGDARGAARAAPAAAPGRALPLAALGLDRRAAGRQVRGELAAHRVARAPLLRPRGRRAAPAGGARALPSRPSRRPLPDRRRADGAQADRRRRRGVQPARRAARGGGRRARAAPPAPPRGPDRALRRPPPRSGGRHPHAQREGARGHGRRGVRDRRRGVARRPAGR